MNAVKKIETLGRNSVLASVGMCNERLRETADKLDKLFVDGNALVNELVQRGEAVESEIKAKLEGNSVLKEKLTNLKAKLGFNQASQEQQLDKLSVKVDELIEQVAKLAEKKAAEQAAKAEAAKKAPAKKTTTRKSTTTKSATAKAAADKPAAAKPAAAKKPATTAKKPAASKTAAEKKAPAKPRVRKTAVKDDSKES